MKKIIYIIALIACVTLISFQSFSKKTTEKISTDLNTVESTEVEVDYYSQNELMRDFDSETD